MLIFLIHGLDTLCWISGVKQHVFALAGIKMNRATLPKIDLSDKNLQLLPKTIFLEKSLQSLDLSGNRLRQRPTTSGPNIKNNTKRTKDDGIESSELFCCAGFLDDLIAFQNLLVLDLSYNGLVTFPTSICGIISLQNLDLSGNLLTSIPLQIKRLAKLQVLSIHGNKIKALPRTFHDLGQLTRLDASSNHFSEFPMVLKRMKSIRKVFFSENLFSVNLLMQQNDVEMYKISKKIVSKDFQSLSYMDISENKIESLDLRNMTSLQHLRCCQNKLIQLQLDGQQLISLCASNNVLQYVCCTNNPMSLRLLDLSNNCFTEIPEWVCSISSLQSLNFSHNHIRMLPYDFWQKLATGTRLINLSYNLLDEIPEVAENFNVQKLLLHHNNINHVPRDIFSSAIKIRTLNLSSNNICALPLGKECVSHKQVELVELYLSFNNLDNDVWDVVLNIPNLQILHMAFNVIDEVSPRISDKLQHCREINLSGNKITYLPDNLQNLKWLRTLRINSNLLSNLISFSSSAHLKILDVSYNMIGNFSLDMIPCNLEVLDLTCNKSQKDLKSICQSIQECSGRNVNLVNVSDNFSINPELSMKQLPWKLGFAKSSTSHEGMSFHQILYPKFAKKKETLFGIIHANVKKDKFQQLKSSLPKILQEEQVCQEHSSRQYLRYVLLRSQRLLHGMIHGLDCAIFLCHMWRDRSTNELNLILGTDDENFTMILCKGGNAMKISWLDESNCSDGNAQSEIQSERMEKDQHDSLFIREIVVKPEDEFIIIANCSFWDYVHADESVMKCRYNDDPVLMAKLLHDLAQGYGCRQDLSVIVVKFVHCNENLQYAVDDVLVSIVSNTVECDSLVPEDEFTSSAVPTCSHQTFQLVNTKSDWRRLTEAELCNSSEYITEMTSKLIMNDLCDANPHLGNEEVMTLKPKYFGDTLLNPNNIKVSWRDLYRAKRKNYRL